MGNSSIIEQEETEKTEVGMPVCSPFSLFAPVHTLRESMI